MKIYNTYEVDWMGQPFKSPSDLTRHHIIKREDGGENDISNYALLTHESHALLHYLEVNNYEAYVSLNSMFLELNRSVCPPTAEYFKIVRAIVKKAKKAIKNAKRVRRFKKR